MVTLHNGADSGSEPPEELLWNIKTVILKTGLSRPSIYRYMKRGRFPARRRVGPNRVAWVPAEVAAWIEGCPAWISTSAGRRTTAARRITSSSPGPLQLCRPRIPILEQRWHP